MYLPDINALRAISILPIPIEEFIVAGYYTSGDGGGGTFTWVDISVTPPMLADDNGIIICTQDPFNPLYNTGYFKRIYSGPINVRWFGAIMGAEISPGVFITDVTPYVHAARDSQFCRDGGSIYFPKGVYVGAFEFGSQQGEINLYGDGQGSELKSNGSSNPVLRLGLHADSLKSHWRFSKVSMLTINGTTDNPEPVPPSLPKRVADGIVFQDWNLVLTEHSGRWVLENVTIKNCIRGIYKPTGNIGNTYSNCLIEYNDFGYYAEDVVSMHAGNDRFLGGHVQDCDSAGICVNASALGGYGQLIIDGTIIENNTGFGIFVKLGANLNRMTVATVELRNIWTEGNATASSVTIDSQTYTPQDYYFEQVRSVTITGSMLRDKLKAIASSVVLENCRAGAIVEIDAESSITANELRYIGTSSEFIFVNAISYDGTSDIANNTIIPTSVWGPLRAVTQTGNNNIMLSQQYDGTELFPVGNPGGTIFTQLNPAYGGILKNSCHVIENNGSPLIGVVDQVNFFEINDDAEMYYVWSIHAYQCNNASAFITGDNIVLGQVILKDHTWTCSYGVKKLKGNSSAPTRIYLSFNLPTGSKMLVCDYQVLKFANFYDAASFLNSRAFAVGHNPCEGGGDG